MQVGLYRVEDSELGECARVTWWVGDAAHYVPRHLYDWMGFTPPFEALPAKEAYEATRARA